ncbi:MAG: ribonuclease P protein component [Opitutales bacterium]
MRFPASRRIRSQGDFQRLRQAPHKLNCGPFFVQAAPASPDQPYSRLGVIASRKVGNAVRRNRARRWFRELFRTHPEALPVPCDLVIIVRPAFIREPFAELEARYLKACLRLTAFLQKDRPPATPPPSSSDPS